MWEISSKFKLRVSTVVFVDSRSITLLRAWIHPPSIPNLLIFYPFLDWGVATSTAKAVLRTYVHITSRGERGSGYAPLVQRKSGGNPQQRSIWWKIILSLWLRTENWIPKIFSLNKKRFSSGKKFNFVVVFSARGMCSSMLFPVFFFLTIICSHFP